MMDSFFIQTTKTDQTADAQADLSLRGAHMSRGTFSHVAVQMDLLIRQVISVVFVTCPRTYR